MLAIVLTDTVLILGAVGAVIAGAVIAYDLYKGRQIGCLAYVVAGAGTVLAAALAR